jgi:hypothetical protein
VKPGASAGEGRIPLQSDGNVVLYWSGNRGGLRVAPLVFRGCGWTEGNCSPPKRSAKASASSGFAKQNTTKSLSSRRREYVSRAAGNASAAVNITSLFLRPRTQCA